MFLQYSIRPQTGIRRTGALKIGFLFHPTKSPCKCFPPIRTLCLFCNFHFAPKNRRSKRPIFAASNPLCCVCLHRCISFCNQTKDNRKRRFYANINAGFPTYVLRVVNPKKRKFPIFASGVTSI